MHGRYLVALLLDLAAHAGRVVLDNTTSPGPQPLPEAQRSDMNHFIGQLHIVLPVLGVDAIRARELTVRSPQRDDLLSPVLHLKHERLGVAARAQQVDGEFTVLTGSRVVGTARGG